jgi:hypothetical protein
MAETHELQAKAQHALLISIANAASKTSSASSLVQLAEAYAWAVAPTQPHGGSTKVG